MGKTGRNSTVFLSKLRKKFQPKTRQKIDKKTNLERIFGRKNANKNCGKFGEKSAVCEPKMYRILAGTKHD